MRIFVDADACPVKQAAEKIAVKRGIPIVFVADSAHEISTQYGSVITVDKGRDSADTVLINHVQKGDVVVSGDFGVASLALGKKAYALSFDGYEYTAENIDRLMFERFLSRKVRMARHGKIKNKQARKHEDDVKFEKALEYIIEREAENA